MKTASKLLIIANTLIFALIPLIVFAGIKEHSTETPVVSQIPIETEPAIQPEVQGVYDHTLSVCVLGECIGIKKSEVGNDIEDVNEYVVENVIPFINDTCGGKTTTENKNGSFQHWSEDIAPNTYGLTERIYQALRYEFEEITVETFKGPYTDGKYADKYIEVDNSTQQLFAWKNGEVIKTINLSAAKDDYVVRGVFPIVDKGVNPKAPSGRYMPYWMGFYYSKSQESWYGLHGLVWWYDDNGKAVYEPRTNIGIRRSNGCVRMVKEDIKFLYENYDRGDHILIHE